MSFTVLDFNIYEAQNMNARVIYSYEKLLMYVFTFNSALIHITYYYTCTI